MSQHHKTICPVCGAEIDSGQRECPNCGEWLSKDNLDAPQEAYAEKEWTDQEKEIRKWAVIKLIIVVGVIIAFAAFILFGWIGLSVIAVLWMILVGLKMSKL